MPCYGFSNLISDEHSARSYQIAETLNGFNFYEATLILEYAAEILKEKAIVSPFPPSQ